MSRRPRHQRGEYSYRVRGPGAFPLEMLSHDEAWPDGSDSAGVIRASLLPPDHPQGLGSSGYTVRLRSGSIFHPDVERWQQYGAAVLA